MPRIFFYPKYSLSPTPPAYLFPSTLYAVRCPLPAVRCLPSSVLESRVTNDERRICRAIICASACKKVEYFRIFSNVSHHFSNIFEYFQTFSNVFKRFQKKLAHLMRQLRRRYRMSVARCRLGHLIPLSLLFRPSLLLCFQPVELSLTRFFAKTYVRLLSVP